VKGAPSFKSRINGIMNAARPEKSAKFDELKYYSVNVAHRIKKEQISKFTINLKILRDAWVTWDSMR
jgi:hypothetical protein